MKSSIKKQIIIYIALCVSVLISVFVMSGCAIQSIINAAGSAAQNGIKPKWDIDINMPILSKKITAGEIFDPDSIMSDMMSGMSDASFDKVTAADLQEGGKYYYPGESCFGLMPGDFVLNCKVEFPGTKEMMGGSVNTSMIEQFMDNFVFSIDDLSYWPWQFSGDLPVDVGSGGVDFGGRTLTPSLFLDVTLDLTIDLDNTGDGSDIKLKGIKSNDATLDVAFIVEKYKGSNIIETIIPKENEIAMEYITIEGRKYYFGSNWARDSKALHFYAENFITDATGDHAMHFNGSYASGDPNDYSQLNVDGFKFTIKNQGENYLDDHLWDINQSQDDGYKYRLRINVSIDLGDTYDIICDIKKLLFDLGTNKTDLSMLNMLDTTNDAKNLGSYFISNLSISNASIYFDAESTLPIDVDLSSLFDNNTDGLTILGDGSPPVVTAGSSEGAVISYFYNEDGSYNNYEVLHFKDDAANVKDKAIIRAKTETKFGLYNGNSNVSDFLQKEDNGKHQEDNGKHRRPSDLYFVNSFTTDETHDVLLSVVGAKGGLKIMAGLVIPISMQVMEDKSPMNLLKALNMDTMIVDLVKVVRDLPAVTINDFGLRITCENKLPMGLSMSFNVTANKTVRGKKLKYAVYLSGKTADIATGEVVKVDESSDNYFVTGYGSKSFEAGAKKGFTYYIYDDSDQTADENGDPSDDARYVYNGTLFDFVYDHSDDVSLEVNIGLLQTPLFDDDDEPVSVKLRDDCYFSMDIDVIGSTTVDIGKM